VTSLLKQFVRINSISSLITLRHSIHSSISSPSPNLFFSFFFLHPFFSLGDCYQIPGQAGYRILCLDGGGSRGIIEIAILSRVMERFPKLEVRHLFDLIVGTSTGAIVAASIGLKKKTLPQLYDLYRNLARRVFKKNILQKLGLLRYAYLLFGAKTFYNISDLEVVIKEQLGGELDFIDTMRDSDSPKVAVLATNYSAQMSKQLFCNYTYPSATSTKDKELRELAEVCLNGEVKLFQAVVASAAAPVYFHPYRIGNALFVDGALIANNPTEIAYKEAQTLWKDRPLDYIVSIGTGKPPEEAVKNNFLSWTTTLVNMATDPEVIHQREKERFLLKVPFVFLLSLLPRSSFSLILPPASVLPAN
jgi:calcium-independent phospholipase A2-gamma